MIFTNQGFDTAHNTFYTDHIYIKKCRYRPYIRSEGFTAPAALIAVLWDLSMLGLIDGYRCFVWKYCFHLQVEVCGVRNSFSCVGNL
jgi:hypothetical protein